MQDNSDSMRQGDGPALPPGDYAGGLVNIGDALRVLSSRAPYPRSWPNGKIDKVYFNVDAYWLDHAKFEANGGGRSARMRREVFERGDSVGVLLYNSETDKVIFVKQFRVATLVTKGRDTMMEHAPGWIEETIAGEVKPKDESTQWRTPEEVAIAEVEEEAGYGITEPEPIASFYSSPGGTSERIFLYFKEVTNKDRVPREGGEKTEDILVVEQSPKDLAARLRARQIHDPKLVIAIYFLASRLNIDIHKPTPLSAGKHEADYIYRGKMDANLDKGQLSPKDQTAAQVSKVKIRLRTGDILGIKGVDVWLNPENSYMIMSRLFDEGVSARIRWGGAEKTPSGAVAVDTIGTAIRVAMKDRIEVSDREIIETTPGELRNLNGVRRLLHLPVARPVIHATGTEVVDIEPSRIGALVKRALFDVHNGNTSIERCWARFRERLLGRPGVCRSVLIPLIGAGEGRVAPQTSAAQILQAIESFMTDVEGNTAITDIHLLAYTDRDVEAYQRALSGAYVAAGAEKDAAPAGATSAS